LVDGDIELVPHVLGDVRFEAVEEQVNPKNQLVVEAQQPLESAETFKAVRGAEVTGASDNVASHFRGVIDGDLEKSTPVLVILETGGQEPKVTWALDAGVRDSVPKRIMENARNGLWVHHDSVTVRVGVVVPVDETRHIRLEVGEGSARVENAECIGKDGIADNGVVHHSVHAPGGVSPPLLVNSAIAKNANCV
jgi:hypothetical protein